MRLTERLAASDPAEQPEVLDHFAHTGEAAELVALLVAPPFPLVPRARDLVLHFAGRRGEPALAVAGAALAADPLGPAAEALADVLARVYRYEPPLRARVVAVLAAAVEDGLARGGDSWSMNGVVASLCECALTGGPLPEVVPLGRRAAAAFRAEEEPNWPAVLWAEKLAAGRGPYPDDEG